MPAVHAPAIAGERQPRVWAALAAVYLIWGFTFVAMPKENFVARGQAEFSPWANASTRPSSKKSLLRSFV